MSVDLELIEGVEDAQVVVQSEEFVERSAGCGGGQVRTLTLL